MEIIVVKSFNSGNTYKLTIMEIKNTNKYKIVNLTTNKISKCTFNSYKDALNDIYVYQSEGKNKVIETYKLLF